MLSGWLNDRLASDKIAQADSSFAENRARCNGTAVHEEAVALLRWDAETRLEEWQQGAEHHEWEAGENLAAVVIKQHNLRIDRDSEAYRMLRMGLCMALLDLEGVRLERSMGRWSAKPQLFASISAPPADAKAASPG